MVALSKEAGRFYDVLMGIPFAVKVTSIVLCWTYSGEILLPREAETLVAGVGAISGGRTAPTVIVSAPLGSARQPPKPAPTKVSCVQLVRIDFFFCAFLSGGVDVPKTKNTSRGE